MTLQRIALGLALFIIMTAACAAPSLRADLIGRYELNGSFADSESFGPDEPLQPDGGTLGPTSYTFGPNQGLALESMLTGTTGDYTLLMDFSFSTVTGYRKIIDFKNQAADPGLYLHRDEGPPVGDPVLEFAGASLVTNSPPLHVFQPDEMVRLVITRDGSTDFVNTYINGDLQFSFSDQPLSSNPFLAVFSGTDNIIHFFKDDAGAEASAGEVDRIEVYDAPLLAVQVAALGGPAAAAVPEPSTFLIALGGLGVVFAARRWRTQRVAK